MDIALTYVDGRDVIWQESYAEAVGRVINPKRFRDWGTLKYLLRGVQKYLPFVENVYLVVSSRSQVPEWVNWDNVHVVLHDEIIPAEYLPTFNSATIEMFLHRIPGLSEEYIYFNDDIFPVRECKPTDFFVDGKIVAKPAKHILANNLYKRHTRNSSALARKAAGLEPSRVFIRPQHCNSPMLRSCCEQLSLDYSAEIVASLSRTRANCNINQYFFTDYLYYTGQVVARRNSCKHFSLATASARKICKFMRKPSRSFMCVNDVNLSAAKFERTRAALLAAFEELFPEPSRYEN